MRLEINFSSKEDVIVPISYNYYVQSLIYNLISNKDYAKFIHDVGYTKDNKKFKLFTFSKLEGNFTLCKETKSLKFYDRKIKLTISSPVEEFIKFIAETILIQNSVTIANNILEIDNVNVIDNIDEKNEIAVYTKTPIVVSSTLESGQTIFYSPLDYCFKERIKKNLLNKYNAYTNLNLEDIDFNIEVINKNNIKKKVVKYKNIFINGYMCELLLKGSSDIIQFAYDASLGEKTSIGFGMIQEKNTNK